MIRRFTNQKRFSSNSASGNRGGFFGGGGSRTRNRPPKKMRGEYIDIAKFVKKASVDTVLMPTAIEHKFSDFGLCPQLQKNLETRKYLIPTPIQDQSIMHTMAGKDMIGLANTGTGKTAAFLLPLINKCFHDRSQNVLIVAPTRELAIQIEEEFKKFTPSLNLGSVVCVGGAPIYKQLNGLRRHPNFVIGTPGRLQDFNKRGLLPFSAFQNVVLDEIDRMLDMGFIDEIRKMLADMPKKRQSLFFSATMPPKIKELTKQFLIDPITVKVSSEGASENVDQDIVRFVGRQVKFDKLKDLLIKADLKKVLIFSETKRDVERLTEGLIRDGFKADSIHGDRKHNQRQKALAKFKEGEVQILVATDVAARGLDIKDITHVINFTVPQTYDDYIHRIGRTGRENKKGFALTFVETN
ncbi:MAG: DEAD/DEAH box helicase [bacterium]|nr:DEAD/DEAH box helicase [bacterium]